MDTIADHILDLLRDSAHELELAALLVAGRWGWRAGCADISRQLVP